jgi:aspartate/methionine/tyrosine aminotransferase
VIEEADISMAEPPTAALTPFHALDIFAAARRLEAAGRTVCHLQAGEPAVPPAPAVIEAVRASADKPHRYTLSAGMPELREALSGYYRDQHGIAVDPGAIMVTMGSSAAFILAFLAALPRDGVIAVTRPGYPAYLNTPAGLGLRTVEIPLSPDNGWRLAGADVEAAYRRARFDALLFASPANPTGAALDRAGLADVIAACGRLGVRVLSDEIYHGLDFRGPSVSAAELSDEAIVINSFSKFYCMTGYRVGWMVLPERLRARTLMLQQNLFISAPTVSQIAAVAALGERDHAEAQKAQYLENGRVLNAGLGALGFGAVREPDGAFYSYVDVSRFTNDSLKFCHEMLEGAGVAAAPGLDFDRTDGNRFVRFSFAGARATIEEGLARMERWLGR